MLKILLDLIHAFFNKAPQMSQWPISQLKPINIHINGQTEVLDFEHGLDYDDSVNGEFLLVLKKFSNQSLPFSEIIICFYEFVSGRYKELDIPQTQVENKEPPIIFIPWNFNLTDIYIDVSESSIPHTLSNFKTSHKEEVEDFVADNLTLMLCDKSIPKEPRALLSSLNYLADLHYNNVAKEMTEVFLQTEGAPISLQEYDLDFHLAIPIVDHINEQIKPHTNKKAHLVNKGVANAKAEFYIELEA